MEKWKDVPGYEGLYKASDQGRIKSIIYRKERLLKQGVGKNGYNNVSLRKDGKTKTINTHSLIWKTFKGDIPQGFVLNHINENKTDNRLCNLMTCSQKTNVLWGTSQERRISKTTKWVIQLTKNNEILHFFPSAAQASRETGIAQGDICNCCNCKLYHRSAGGYLWKYAE